MLYTSYYGNLSYIDSSIVPVIISNSTVPAFCGNQKLKAVMPDWEDVSAVKRGDITQDTMISNYLRKLSEVDFRQLMKPFEDASDFDFAFVCYETPNNFCHRHFFAEVLRRLGYAIEECPNKKQYLLFDLSPYEEELRLTMLRIKSNSSALTKE